MTIIVTGHSRGLGKEITQKILTETSHSVIGISRSEPESVKDNQIEFGSRFVHLSYDLTDIEGIKPLFLDSLKQLGPITGLVNNSAIAYDDLVTNMNAQRLEQLFQINVLAPMHLTKYVIRDMIFHKSKGSIVFVSSVSAHTAYKGLCMYASTKGALEAFSRGVAREWGKMGIRSNCVVPGFMETSMSDSLSDEQKDRIYRRTSLRSETNVECVADTVLFLLSHKSQSITGTSIHVDSGTI
ncbi:SDR family NAD(P)-dependent oxidoreductase [Paenibacillus kobensis]|uniref:SDR family NAD(P)-dependent oxidoreductase n=1 Tax=Paenibacillus kobensis TaxID=59841 RepID=UPI000FD7A4F2|nr:SDR family oxidoreductase [Paenibacillus kobensis]